MKQILKGPGQVHARGECKRTDIVFTFKKLTKNFQVYADFKVIEALAEKLKVSTEGDKDHSPTKKLHLVDSGSDSD